MIKQTLYFGNPAHLHKKDRQLIVSLPDGSNDLGKIPIEDIGVVILDHWQLTITHALMQTLMQNNVALVGCDSRHHPASIMLPMEGHHVQAERFRHQIAATDPLKKQLWGQTIKAKIANQAAMLNKAGKNGQKLEAMVMQLRSGDPDNFEGRAASVYWKTLFDEHAGFSRDPNGADPNVQLNYGYAIIRAIVARGLVSSGLLPTLGIFHRNRYNAYALADDIMEPYRPWCDEIVYEMWQNGEVDPAKGLTKAHKVKLLKVASADVVIDKKSSPLMVAISRTTSSLNDCYEGKRKKIVYPKML